MGEVERAWWPLSEAPEQLAHPKLRREAARQVREASRQHRESLPATLSQPATSAQAWTVLQNAIEGLTAPWQKANDLRWSMQRELMLNLIKGLLEARGVRMPASPKLTREPIPAHFFAGQPKIKWHTETASNLGMTYEVVEVRRTPPTKHVGDYRVSNNTRDRRPGRPSKVGRVEEAIASLTRRGQDLNRVPRKSAYKLIRDELLGMGVSIETGFSDPVIQRALVSTLGPRR